MRRATLFSGEHKKKQGTRPPQLDEECDDMMMCSTLLVLLHLRKLWHVAIIKKNRVVTVYVCQFYKNQEQKNRVQIFFFLGDTVIFGLLPW